MVGCERGLSSASFLWNGLWPRVGAHSTTRVGLPANGAGEEEDTNSERPRIGPKSFDETPLALAPQGPLPP